jgi:hypothetical protein
MRRSSAGPGCAITGRRLLLCSVLVAVCRLHAVAQEAGGGAEGISNVPETARPLVVALLTYQPGRSLPQIGAGVVIGEDATRVYVATALHVVDGADRILARFEAARTDTIQAELVAQPEEGNALDLAVIALPRSAVGDEYGASLDRLGDPGRLDLEAPVSPIGCPDEVCWTGPTPADRVLAATPLEILFQSDFVKRGSSGGALFDRWWEVVGIVTQSDPPRARAIPMDYVVEQAQTWGVPVSLRRPRIPRAGYRTGIAVAGLYPTASPGDRFPSTRVTLTYAIRHPVSLHAGFMRLAPGELSGCPAGDESDPFLAARSPCEVVVNAVTAGLGGSLVLGHFSVRAFGELGGGLVQGRFDRGGVNVVLDGIRYLPSYKATTERFTFVAGTGVELEYIVLPRTVLHAVGGFWTYDGDPFVEEPDFPPDFLPNVPRLFWGLGVRVGL